MALAVFLGALDAAAQGLTFDQTLSLGASTPEVEAVRTERRARERGDVGVGGTLGPTSVTLLPGAAVTAGATDFDFQLSATQGWNLEDLGDKARVAARLERRVLGAEERLRALESRLGAARLWLDLRTTEELEAELARGIGAAEERVKSAARGRDAGVVTTTEVTEAEEILAALGARRLELEGRRFAASHQLRSLLGAPSGDLAEPLTTLGPTPSPELPDRTEMIARLAQVDSLPGPALAELRRRTQAARAVEARATRAALLTTGVQLERGAGDAWVAYGIVGLTWSGPQGQRGESAARALEERAVPELELARRAARVELTAAIHEWEHDERAVQWLETRTLPSLEALVVGRRRAFSLGEETRATWLDAEHRLREAKMKLVEARGAAALARMHLWLLLATLRQEAA